MNAAALERALRIGGLPCRVEERGTLAIILVGEGFADLESPRLRAQVLALASEHGFQHVAVEIPGPGEAVRRG